MYDFIKRNHGAWDRTGVFGREGSRALLYWKKMDRKVAVAAAACVLSNSDNGDKVDSEWMHQ